MALSSDKKFRKSDSQTDKQTDSQTAEQTDRQIIKQTNSQSDSQTDRETIEQAIKLTRFLQVTKRQTSRTVNTSPAAIPVTMTTMEPADPPKSKPDLLPVTALESVTPAIKKSLNLLQHFHWCKSIDFVL